VLDALGIFENDFIAPRIRVSGIAFILDPEGISTPGIRNAVRLSPARFFVPRRERVYIAMKVPPF
jgi:hypothetical protein